ncbi:MAG: insulinase family protein [Clostridia bacterium]|nr:MAG: insulinase family protein [Clostridia bacterium]
MFHKEVLPNGIRVVTEEVPHVQSAAIGIWVRTGSRHETPDIHGASHFLEHLMFKGTARRTAREIAEELEAVGGVLNAFTTKEYTCFYARVLGEHVDLAIDLLSDMLLHSRFAPEDIAREKNVILEEIRMYEDSPDELVHDLFASTIWDGHPLGRAILGSVDSVASLTREQIVDYYSRRYRAGNIVIAAAGKINHQALLDKLAPFAAGELNGGGPDVETRPVPKAETRVVVKDTEQTQICLGTPGLSQEDEEIYSLNALNGILGGGVSSRLFQEIRENRGLAYSVYSYHSAYVDSGLLAIYAGTHPANVKNVVGLILEELARIKDQGVTGDELNRIKEQTRGNLLMSMENVSNRMSRLGKTELCFDRVISVEEVLEKVRLIDMSQVQQLAARMFNQGAFAFSAIGPSQVEIDLEKMQAEAGL